MRCFVAIDLSDEVRHAVGDCMQQLKPLSRHIRWVPPVNLHLTIKFIGEVPEGRLNEVGRALQHSIASSQPFSLEVSGAGVFPNQRRPHILWVGIRYSAEIMQLQAHIEDATSRLGFAREKRAFSPHLTIGRLKDGRGEDAALSHFRTFQNAFFGSIDVREIGLVQSILAPSGATYALVGRYQIG